MSELTQYWADLPLHLQPADEKNAADFSERIYCADKVDAIITALQQRLAESVPKAEHNKIVADTILSLDNERTAFEQRLAAVERERDEHKRWREKLADDLHDCEAQLQARERERDEAVKERKRSALKWMDDLLAVQAQLQAREQEHLDAVRDRDSARELLVDLNKLLQARDATIVNMQKDCAEHSDDFAKLRVKFNAQRDRLAELEASLKGQTERAHIILNHFHEVCAEKHAMTDRLALLTKQNHMMFNASIKLATEMMAAGINHSSGIGMLIADIKAQHALGEGGHNE